MSFNRGFRRDDRSSYRSNMGQGPGQRSINVSPWECGVVPNAGMSRNAIPLQSLLPTPQTQTNPNILSQQQHALVMASNLLSNLGLLQQQPQHQQGLPSLINMSTLNNMGNAGQFRLQSQNYGQPSNRYNNMGSMRRKPQDGHRVEPYKNRPRPNQSQQLGQLQGRRPIANKPAQDRRSGPGFRGTNNKISPIKALSDLRQKLKKPIKTSDESEAESKELETVDKSKLIEKTPAEELQVKSSLIDEEAKRDDDDSDGVKRDWKDEKKTDQVPPAEGTVSEDKSAEGKADDAEAEAGPVKDKAATNSKVNEETSPPKSTELKFSCHVCSKFMYDEQSLNNHTKSKMHKLAMIKLDENYKVQVEALRLNMQESMHKQDLELQLQRGYRANVNRPRDFCKMCDLHFFGSIANHRKHETHLRLKTFLHPRCVPCGKEFPTRMEWENHKLTVAHQTCSKVKDQTGVRAKCDRTAIKHERFDKSAAYDPLVPNGQEYLITGQQCRACEMFFERRADARAHCKTQEHYDNCVKAKASEEEAVAAADNDATAEQCDVAKVKEEGDSTKADETPTSEADVSGQAPELSESLKDGAEDNEGNWKRRRVAETEEDDDEGDVVITTPLTKRKVELLVIEDTPPPVKSSEQATDASNLYDPLEEDEEMAVDETLPVKAPATDKVNDTVLEDLDREIDSILDTVDEKVANEETEATNVDTKAVTPSRAVNKARRGIRGRKRK